MSRFANDQIPGLVERSRQQGRTGMCKVVNETKAGWCEAGFIEVCQQRLQRSLNELRAGRLEPSIKEDRAGIALAGHRHEASNAAFEPKKHQAGIIEYCGDIHPRRRLARDFEVR